MMTNSELIVSTMILVFYTYLTLTNIGIVSPVSGTVDEGMYETRTAGMPEMALLGTNESVTAYDRETQEYRQVLVDHEPKERGNLRSTRPSTEQSAVNVDG
ncbi:hypothetical protein GQ43DRAFT_472760 [Delitschia confertaspora ATCC 74209]|uniref:Uncharacterized protein n=1 Tax=Delitschia confertaspora ATCC 74209 TaxID=1513339 RepID=A0A9P4JJ92_9PLEO|nr:hypothetical protein GQ43DRAFT_472760 [Delitschia confertaspora ATCC 74209]